MIALLSIFIFFIYSQNFDNTYAVNFNRLTQNDVSQVEQLNKINQNLLFTSSGIKSYFETAVSSEISYYGRSFFENTDSYRVSQNVQVTPDYIIGPGDQIIISLWGKISERWVVDVQRDGTIYLPKIGVINISGVEFKNIRDFLKKEISRYYTDFDINVSMGNLRSIRVYVVGYAEKPGSYILPGISNVVNALVAAGGPSKSGSMRKIEIRRNGAKYTEFDLYDLLIHGINTGDKRLVNEDVVYIYPAGKLISVESGVKKPAIYELKDGEKLFDLIKLAGGFDNSANRKRVSVKRIFEGYYRNYIDFDIENIDNDSSKNIDLFDGDIININPVVEFDRTVNVSGSVVYPGKVGIKENETRVLDVIKLAGGTLPEASDEVELLRFITTSTGVFTEKHILSLSKINQNDPDHNITLRYYDSITVKRIPQWYPPAYVSVNGEVNSPGSYAIRKGEKLSSILERAGGFKDEAYPQGIVFTRISVRKQQEKNLKDITDRLEKELLSQSSESIYSSLLQEEVQSKKANFELKQKFLQRLKEARPTGRVYIVLNSIDELKKSNYDVELEDGDSIFIPRKPQSVIVTGSVMSEGSYIYNGGSYIKYIKLAGGYTRYADKSKVFIIHPDGSAEKAGGFIFKTRVQPGDVIVVPEKFESIAWLREIKDITQIITNLALSAGVVIKVF